MYPEKETSVIIQDRDSASSSKNNARKHLKTMEEEWNPVDAKKIVNFRDEMRKTKTILINSTLNKPKRSLYEM